VVNGQCADPVAQSCQTWEDGDLGDFLVFPYYNIRTGNTANADQDATPFHTSFTISNTSADYSVLLKVRFYDYRTCQDTLDFQVFLSPKDEIVGIVQNDIANTALPFNRGQRPRVWFPDTENTCRIPWNNGSAYVPPLPPPGSTDVGAPMDKYFAHPLYGDASDQPTDVWLEGMMVVAPMAAFRTDNTIPSQKNGLIQGRLDGDRVVHGSDGMPHSCDVVSDTLLYGELNKQGLGAKYDLQLEGGLKGPAPGDNNVYAQAERVGNWLRGTFEVTNRSGGYTAGGEALVLANMDDPIILDPQIDLTNPSNSCLTGGFGAPCCADPFGGMQQQCGGPYLFGQNQLSMSSPIYNQEGHQWEHNAVQWFAPGMKVMAAAAAVVDARLGERSLINNWSINPANGVGMDWIITYPTARALPQTYRLQPLSTAGTNCRYAIDENSRTNIWDREENRPGIVTDIGGVSGGFGTPEVGRYDLCNCVNVLSFSQPAYEDRQRVWAVRPEGLPDNWGKNMPNPIAVLDTGDLPVDEQATGPHAGKPQPFGWGDIEVNPASFVGHRAVMGFSYQVRNLGVTATDNAAANSYAAIKRHNTRR
jgi:hypothetical protein